MNELCINYSTSKTKKIGAIVIGIYMSVFCLYFLVTELLGSRYEILFYTSLVGVVLGLILFLSSLFSHKPLFIVNNTSVVSNISGSKVNVEWSSVSRVNMGVSYIVFFLNGGQKQQKVDLSALTYLDMKSVKDKVTELSEFKNIPYQND